MVTAARRLRSTQPTAAEVVDVVGRGFFYTRTPSQAPRLYVADLGERGRWASVFTSPERLASAVGECDYLAMTGAEFFALTPDNVGLVIDPGEDHELALRPEVIRRGAKTWSEGEGS